MQMIRRIEHLWSSPVKDYLYVGIPQGGDRISYFDNNERER
jgi:hypothetical protein